MCPRSCFCEQQAMTYFSDTAQPQEGSQSPLVELGSTTSPPTWEWTMGRMLTSTWLSMATSWAEPRETITPMDMATLPRRPAVDWPGFRKVSGYRITQSLQDHHTLQCALQCRDSVISMDETIRFLSQVQFCHLFVPTLTMFNQFIRYSALAQTGTWWNKWDQATRLSEQTSATLRFIAGDYVAVEYAFGADATPLDDDGNYYNGFNGFRLGM